MVSDPNVKKLLVIGHTFPEPLTTGAGSRMMQLLHLFLEHRYEITFASTAVFSKKSANLAAHGIREKNILLNDTSFDIFIKELDPAIVVFDRYITEEQFGWRITEHCPNALKILDTEDLHFLRKARKEAIGKGLPVDEANIFSTIAKRELASVLRCDLTLVISEYEMQLLQKVFKIPSDILYYLPFLVDASFNLNDLPTFSERLDFMAIGNFLHAPNVDSVLQLKKIWPEIRKQLPDSELHIYGAYAPQHITQLQNSKEGFLIKGWTEDLTKTMGRYRLQLAPLRFGAGLKGKLMDAMCHGLPSITTEVGAEGLCGDLPFGGKVTLEIHDFIAQAVSLYSEEKTWKEMQQNGFDIIKNRFEKRLFTADFLSRIDAIRYNLESHRQNHFLGQILQHHSLQASRYLSKWIEAKNAPVQNSSPVCFANSDEVRDEYRDF